MCDVCLHNPCVPQCPNYQPKKIGICKRCGYILYDTDEIWIDDEDQIFCSEKTKYFVQSTVQKGIMVFIN